MIKVILTCGILLGFVLPGWALSTDFKDLILETEYHLGDVINSGDLSFEVVGFPGEPGLQIFIEDGMKAGGTGHELHLFRTVGLEFQLPSQVQEISFFYGDFYPGYASLIVVNGERSTERGLPLLDGIELGGVDVAVSAAPVMEGVQGIVTLTGPIQSLIVGGTGTYIDDVQVIVPEPGAITLGLLAAIPCGVLARKRSPITS